MAKDRRDKGAGTIYQREDETWQGKIYLSRKADGSPKFKYVSGKTKTEVKRKIREFNFTGSEMKKKTITVEEYFILCKMSNKMCKLCKRKRPKMRIPSFGALVMFPFLLI